MRSTNHAAPHFVVFSVLPLPPSQTQIWIFLSIVFSKTFSPHSSCFVPQESVSYRSLLWACSLVDGTEKSKFRSFYLYSPSTGGTGGVLGQLYNRHCSVLPATNQTTRCSSQNTSALCGRTCQRQDTIQLPTVWDVIMVYNAGSACHKRIINGIKIPMKCNSSRVKAAANDIWRRMQARIREGGKGI